MLKHTVTVYVDRPVEEVFQFVTTCFTDHGILHPSVVHTHLEQPGPVQVGTRGKGVLDLGARIISYEFEFTEYERNRSLALSGEGEGAQGSVRCCLAGAAGKTGTDLEMEITVKLGMARFLAPVLERLIAGRLRGTVEDMAARIKLRMEEG